ncbi:bifunctional DNA-binding transcriptional regulator/O6-methylguanine-DNA methyltransferase Ada [Litchfieldella rifensis]|uniref:Bifunctional DNA-binding transcriptional regulator/O6-methylguanine-DNA methyltransferase Ada n=1 Tax=Litchfieldella rifensis TaxID=762643 RepID=A0ABV7LPZ9_9GAMM
MTEKPPNQAHPFISDDDKWGAVQRRDVAADGVFVYAVRSTGIYCRPSCAARRPRRENVEFHVSVEAAEHAGFRPCKRCRPQETPFAERHALAVAQACRLIESAEDSLALDDLAKAAGMSRFHFHRVFKASTGVTPRAYAAACRADRVREELLRSETVTEAIYESGFNSNGRFYAASSRILGMTPTTFRARGSGAEIRFALGECSLGTILVAASDKGICAILLGDDPDELLRDFQDRFANATLVAGDADFDRWVAHVVGFVEAPQLGLDLPLDVRGTAFQQRVWHALTEIPVGSTVSYAEVAERIGSPKAVRAVARACGANALAVAIPCHRVVRADGALSGYRWGIERKRVLLDREAT